MKADLVTELRQWLSCRVVTQDNIGDLRRECFVPWDSKWNSIVRDVTAEVEQSLSFSKVEVVLQPCPFCGSADIDVEGGLMTAKENGILVKKHFPVCNNCNASAESVENWNGRSVPVK